MPFSHLRLIAQKPGFGHLWFKDKYPDQLNHVGDHLKKRRLDLKMKSVECRKLFAVDKGTLSDWEKGKHKPIRRFRPKIVEFLGYNPF